MDILGQLLTGNGLQATWAPTDDRWYQPIGSGGMSTAGVRVDAEGAKKISAWFRGRDILATSLAMLPLQLLERLPNDEGSEPADNHALYDVLKRKPNAEDDSFVWRWQAMYDLIDCGHAYSWLNIGTRWELPRIDPALVTRERITKGVYRGRTVYHVRDEGTGQSTTHTRDDIFHLRRPDGKGILESARDSLGLALVTDAYASRIYSKGFLNGGVIEVPGEMGDDSMRAMAKSFVTAIGEWHMPRILPLGAKLAQGQQLTPENAQMLLSRKFSINEVARWLGLPPHMLGDLERSTNNNIEHQGQEFVTYSLGPWLSLWEFGINDQLVLQPNRFFAEFTRDALVRGDIAARWEAYMKAVTTGTFTRNEVRRLENKKKLPGLDEPLDPTHLTGSAAGGSQNSPKRPAKAQAEEPETRIRAIVMESAARVQRKEIAAAQKAAVKHAQNSDAFAAWATSFYNEHVTLVMATMCLDVVSSRFYCESQRDELIEQGIAATEWWTPDWLVGLAVDLPRPDPMFTLAKSAIEKPDAPIQVNAGIEKGAISVSSPVSAPITVQPPNVTTTTPVTIADGAIRLVHSTTVEAPPAVEPVSMDVTKTVTRGKDGIEQVHEEHRPVKKRKRDGGV